MVIIENSWDEPVIYSFRLVLFLLASARNGFIWKNEINAIITTIFSVVGEFPSQKYNYGIYMFELFMMAVLSMNVIDTMNIHYYIMSHAYYHFINAKNIYLMVCAGNMNRKIVIYENCFQCFVEYCLERQKQT